MTPYRDDRESWQRTLEEAAELAMQDAQSFAGRVPTARRQLERVVHALAMARAEAERVPGRADLATLITALESVRAALLGKLALAEAMPDIVVTPPAQKPDNPDRVVIQPPPVASPAPPAARSPARSPLEMTLPLSLGARATNRGMQLRMVEVAVRTSDVVAAAALVRSHVESPRTLDDDSRARLERARTILERAFSGAEKLLRDALLTPDPSAREIDAALVQDWNDVYAEVAALRDVVIAARGLLR